MTFEQFGKQLLKNKKFREIAAKSEPDYQLARSLMADKIKKRMAEDKMNDLTITDNDAIILTLNSPALAC